MKNQDLGLLLGFIGVVIFATSLPATRYLMDSLSYWDVGLMRGIIAALASVLILLVFRQPLPNKRQCGLLLLGSIGIVYGFPIFTAVGMANVPASHGAVVLGALPITTAILGAYVNREKPSLGFWLVSLFGLLLVVVYAIIQHGSLDIGLYWGDLALLAAVVLAASGYSIGGKLAKELSGWQVICWTMVLASPITIVWSIFTVDYNSLLALDYTAMGVLVFLSIFCSLIGFFFWYGGMAVGGIARVSQLQYAQPFLTMLLAVWLLDEDLNFTTIAFMTAIVAVIALSRKMRVDG